jgi:hypothetical protein
MQRHKLADLRALFEYKRDVLYRNEHGQVTERKRAWFLPKTLCDPAHCDEYLTLALDWVERGKPVTWDEAGVMPQGGTSPVLARHTLHETHNVRRYPSGPWCETCGCDVPPTEMPLRLR